MSYSGDSTAATTSGITPREASSRWQTFHDALNAQQQAVLACTHKARSLHQSVMSTLAATASAQSRAAQLRAVRDTLPAADGPKVAAAVETADSITLTEALARIQQLTEALATRGEIGRAQGILMERFGVDADTAFEILKRLSSQSNRKLREVAELVATNQGTYGLPSRSKQVG